MSLTFAQLWGSFHFSLSLCQFLLWRHLYPGFHWKHTETPVSLTLWGGGTLSVSPLLQHGCIFTWECGSENTSTWIQHPAGDEELWPQLPHTCTQGHTHTHWGDAAGHRTAPSCFYSEDTAGWRSVGCGRQHEHTPPTLGSGLGLWSEREDQSAVDSVEWDCGPALWELCKIIWLDLALPVYVGQ